MVVVPQEGIYLLQCGGGSTRGYLYLSLYYNVVVVPQEGICTYPFITMWWWFHKRVSVPIPLLQCGGGSTRGYLYLSHYYNVVVVPQEGVYVTFFPYNFRDFFPASLVPVGELAPFINGGSELEENLELLGEADFITVAILIEIVIDIMGRKMIRYTGTERWSAYTA